jgi:lipopolysaccharide export system protein LptC
MTTIVGGMDGPIGGPDETAEFGSRERPENERESSAGDPADVAMRFSDEHPAWRGGLAAAGRHSALVVFLRRAILIGCSIALLAVGGAVLFKPFRSLVPDISIGQVDFDGTKVTLETPRISGFQKDQRPYSIKALKGIQDLAAPNIIELLGIDAELGTSDAKTLKVMASRAVYDSDADHLVLEGDVHIANTGGYDASMPAASIDFKAGSLISDAPVHVTLDGGVIAAEKMAITEHGHKISFVGMVRSVFDADNKADEASASAAPRT